MRNIFPAISVLILTAAPALADPIGITDIAGRQVTIERPVEKVILGEGRLLYAVAALDTENPFARVVGWRDDLIVNDPQTYAMYRERFPQADDIPTFGGIKDGTFDAELAITLAPDLVIMNLEAKGATEDAGLDDKLAAVGIPVVFIDFRAERIAHVAEVLEATPHDEPLVFIERAAGYTEECCMSFGSENFGLMVEMAGGRNLAADIIPGAFGTVNAEQIVASDPDAVIATGANWETGAPGGGWVGLGPNADLDEARAKLAALMERPAFTGSQAVANGNVHAAWHQFYNSPYQFVVIEQMAKWLHPDPFADLDPEATFRELHERFLPVPYEPGYFVSLSPES